MITNILDRRTHSQLWRTIDAVAEATWHDNAPPNTPDHDRAVPDPAHDNVCAARSNLSLAEAVLWAQTFNDDVTLYLYDAGSKGDWET
jgi:hypothetical protein